MEYKDGMFKKYVNLEDSTKNYLLLTDVQIGDSAMMIYPIAELVAYLSKFFTLQQGDLIFTGTPAGVGPVAIGDVLTGFLEGTKRFEINIK